MRDESPGQAKVAEDLEAENDSEIEALQSDTRRREEAEVGVAMEALERVAEEAERRGFEEAPRRAEEGEPLEVRQLTL